MTEQELLTLKPELDRFLAEYSPLFGRPEDARHARCFVQGLLDGRERRSVEDIAQAIGGCNATSGRSSPPETGATATSWLG